MVKCKAKLDSSARQFIRLIRKNFKPSKIILFGSRAYGEPQVFSDYDFIIVSDEFAHVHWLDRISGIVIHWDSDKPIDVLPYTPKEFADKMVNSSFIREAARKGIEV